MGISKVSDNENLFDIQVKGITKATALNQYLAIGFVEARYLPSTDKFYKGFFQVGDVIFSGTINHALAKWLKKNPRAIDSTNIWRVYPCSPHHYSNICLIAIAVINDPEYESDKFLIRGRLYKWDERKKTFVLKVKRNISTPERLKSSQLFQPSFFKIRGKLPSTPKRGQFWEVSCTLESQKLVLNSASLLITNTKKENNRLKYSALERNISMIEARAEITLKFNTIPTVREIGNKKVELDLLASNGVVFTIALKGKSWRKAKSSMEEYADWIALVNGKLGNPTDKGFEVLEAGIQIWEKKPKAVEPQAGEAVPVSVEAGS